MADNLSVTVTADVAQLRAQLAVAQADLRAFNSQVRSLANEARTSSDATRATLLVDLEQATAKAATAKSSVTTLSKALAEGTVEGGAFATATRELRAAFDEISSGRTRMLPGTLAIIGSRVLGLSPAMLAGAAAATGLAGALIYLAIHAEEAARALADVQAGARFSGNMDITKEQIQGLAATIAHTADVSSSDAMVIAGNLARIHGETTPEIRALSAEIGDYAAVTGMDAKKATEALVRAFDDPLKEGEKFIRGLAGVTQAQLDAAHAATLAGKEYDVERQMIQALDQALGRARSTLDAANLPSVPQQTTRYQSLFAHQRAAVQQEMEQRRKVQAETINDAMAQLRNLPESPQAVLQRGMAAASRENVKGQEIEKVTADIGAMNAALAQAKAAGDSVTVDKLNASLKAAQERLKELEKPPHQADQPSVMAGFQEQLAQMHAAGNESRAQELATDRAFWANILATQKLSAKDRLEVERNLATATSALNREAATTARQIAQMDSTTTAEIAKQQLEAKKNALEEEVAAGRLSHTQELADLRQLTEQEYQLDLQRLQNELSTLQPLTVEYARTYDQIRKLKAEHVTQMAALDRQAAAAQKQDHDRVAKEWEATFAPITRAFDQSIQGMVMGTQTWQQAVSRGITSILGEFISAEATKLAHWAATQIAELTIQQATDTAKTASSTAATAAGLAAHAVASKTSVMQNAYSAAAAVYNDVAQIPYVGWVLAPAAAAAAFAGVAAFGAAIPSAAGGYDVPADTLAMIHKNEVVLPAALADQFRAGAAAVGGGGGGGVVAPTFNIQALDASSVRSLLLNQQGTIAQGLAQAMRTGNSSLAAALRAKAA